MSDPAITTLANTSCLNHHYQLPLSEKPGTAPQFRLKLAQTFDESIGPETLRTISIRMRPAAVLARAIFEAETAYVAARASKVTS